MRSRVLALYSNSTFVLRVLVGGMASSLGHA
jgi:hypothetical protein